MLYGKHLIAGTWTGATETFQNMPVDGAADLFAVGMPQLVAQAVEAAGEAFANYSATSRIDWT